MKKNHSIIVGLAFAVLAYLNAQAQQPDFLFEHPYPYQLDHTVFWEERVEVVHLEVASDGNSEGYCFVAASDSKNYNFYETDSVKFMPIVYKVSPEGDVISELALGYEGRYSMIVRLFEAPDKDRCCLAVGIVHDNDLHYASLIMATF